jgi:hypothetical protein
MGGLYWIPGRLPPILHARGRGHAGRDIHILRTQTPRRRGSAVVAVPLHRELATGTLAGILRRVGMTADEFRALL